MPSRSTESPPDVQSFVTREALEKGHFMDGNRFDRIARTLVATTPRRETLKVAAAGGLAALGALFNLAGTVGRKQKRCRKRRKSCGGNKKCCGKNTACRTFPTPTCATLSGRRCCGLEGAPCNNDLAINNCDCCDGLFCGGVPGQPGLCQEEPS